jgi:hypothetical protein
MTGRNLEISKAVLAIEQCPGWYQAKYRISVISQSRYYGFFLQARHMAEEA